MKYCRSKSFLVFLLIILIIYPSILLTGCGSKAITDNTYVKGQDFQYMYFTPGGGYYAAIAESENGYYFLGGYFLYYADKKTMKPVILCNKPNCLHQDETNPEKVYNCNAFFSNSGDAFIAYYDGNIYLTSKNVGSPYSGELVKISADGTKRSSVLSFDNVPRTLAIHRGKLYYAQQGYNKNQKSVYCIMEYDLKELNAKPREIYNGELEGGNIQDLICYGNNLYFKEHSSGGETFIGRDMRYDILTGKTSRLFPELKDKEFEMAYSPAIYKDKLYYSVTKSDNQGNVEYRKHNTCDLDGKNKKELESVDKDKIYKYSSFLADQQFLYLNDLDISREIKPKNTEKLEVLNEDRKAIDSIDTGSIDGFTSILCGGDLHLFVISKFCIGNKLKIFYADKSKFGTGKIELKLLFEVGKDKMWPSTVTKDDD